MRKWSALLIIIIFAFLAYLYLYKDHRDIDKEKAEHSLSSADLFKNFSVDPINSEKKYLNKTIEVTGKITNQSKNTITLDQIVFCQFTNTSTLSLQMDSQIKVKGRFIGFDDLVEEVKLDQCSIIN